VAPIHQQQPQQQLSRPEPIQQTQPRTFHMEKLLHELKQIDTDKSQMTMLGMSPQADNWSQEYFSLNSVLLNRDG
jgi:hypothetical protein